MGLLDTVLIEKSIKGTHRQIPPHISEDCKITTSSSFLGIFLAYSYLPFSYIKACLLSSWGLDLSLVVLAVALPLLIHPGIYVVAAEHRLMKPSRSELGGRRRRSTN